MDEENGKSVLETAEETARLLRAGGYNAGALRTSSDPNAPVLLFVIDPLSGEQTQRVVTSSTIENSRNTE